MENDLNEIKNEIIDFRKKVKDLNKSGKTESSVEMRQQFQKIRGLLVTIILKAMHKFYKESKNPLCAWEAFHLSKDNKIEIPDWVLDYFYTSAVNLLTIDKVGDRASTEVCSALGMIKEMGRRGVFLRHQDFKTHLHGACLAIRMKKIDPQRNLLDNICEEIGEKFNASKHTVHEWVKTHRKYAELIVDTEIATGVLIKYTPGYPMMFLYNPPK